MARKQNYSYLKFQRDSSKAAKREAKKEQRAARGDEQLRERVVASGVDDRPLKPRDGHRSVVRRVAIRVQRGTAVPRDGAGRQVHTGRG